MTLSGNAQQVWIFIGESDQWNGKPLSLALLELLKQHRIAGGTVLRGIAGFGAHSFIHTAALVELSSDLPIVVTFVDRAERVAEVLPTIKTMVKEGMITTAPVEVLKYTARTSGPFPPHLTVADVMSRDLAAVPPETPVAEVVGLLLNRELRSVLVTNPQQQVLGIITDGDLLSRGATALPLALQRELPLDEQTANLASLTTHPETADDLMTPNPITLPDYTPLDQAAAIMAQHGLKRLPVVNPQKKLVGIISRSDLLTTIAEGIRQHPGEPLVLPPNGPQTASDLMNSEVPTVQADTPLSTVLERLLENEKRRVVVLDSQRHVIGIISDGDVMRRAAKPVRPGAIQTLAAWLGGSARPQGIEVAVQDRTAADVMSSPVITVTGDAPIAEVIRLMMQHRIKRLPVLNSDGQLIGLVGRARVLAALGQQATHATSAP